MPTAATRLLIFRFYTAGAADQAVASIRELGAAAAQPAMLRDSLDGYPVSVLTRGSQVDQVRRVVRDLDPAAVEVTNHHG